MMLTPIKNRHVFYIGGFDPKGVSSFFQKHKAQLQHYASLSGVAHRVGAREKVSTHSFSWSVVADHPSHPTHTTFEYLAWDDIVRTHWARTPAGIARQTLRCLIDFSLSGAIQSLHKLAPATARAALYPYLLVLGAILCIVGLSAVIFLVLLFMLDYPRLAGLGAMTAAGVGLAFGWKTLKNVPSMWFLRVVDFANTIARNNDAHINLRITAWCDRILEVIEHHSTDEIIVVGYSAGSTLSVPLMAQLLKHKAVAPNMPEQFSLLTLGNCIPVAAALKSGVQIRADLATIGNSQLAWLDYTAPIDWGSFPLVNPIQVYAPLSDSAPDKRSFISPQFHLLFDAENYQKIKIDKYHVHELYLQCTPKIGKYDFFNILYGQNTVLRRLNESKN